MQLLRLLMAALLLVSWSSYADNKANSSDLLVKIKLPSGFHISIYAKGVSGARQMALGKEGIVYVGSHDQGKVYAIIPNQSHTQAKQVITLTTGLNSPSGVAFYQGSLYVAEIHRILVYKRITEHLHNPPKPIVINDQLPKRRWHGYRYIKFSPDGWLYIGIGMPCNTCNYRKSQPLFGTIVRMQANGRDLQIYAKGIRNTVGFDWNPKTNVLWFTDNGQDRLGDNVPPDEIDRAPKAGMDFGFPYVYGDNVVAPGYRKKNVPKNLTPPAYNLPAHVAPLGMAFYTGAMFPKRYHNQLFIAEHGSWNRSSKVGYQIVLATIADGKVTEVVPFATGWLQGESTLGRPVDILNLPNGSLLVSDDFTGMIYRISYQLVQ